MVHRLSALALLALALTPARAPAQSPYRAVILTRMPAPAPAASALFEVDPASGVLVPLSGFAGDAAVPQAVTYDLFNGDILVAVQDPAGSLILRLGYSGTNLVRQRAIAVVPGPVSRLHVGIQGVLKVLVDGPSGGLYSVPRNGGSLALVAPLPYATAYREAGNSSYFSASVVLSPPTGNPSVASFSSYTLTGSVPMPGLTGRRITGYFDAGTSAIRYPFTDDLGGSYKFEYTTGWVIVPWILQPALPPGGSVAMKQGPDFYTYFLGDATTPYLRRTYFQGPAVQIVAGPVPGAPVDFALKRTNGPYGIAFGTPCNGGGTIGLSSPPQLGNSVLAVTLQGALPLAPTVLALGASDQSWSATALPLTMPGGCLLHAAGDIQLWGATDGTGAASFTVPVPNVPSLSGTFVFAQWVQVAPAGLAASDALAALLGP